MARRTALFAALAATIVSASTARAQDDGLGLRLDSPSDASREAPRAPADEDLHGLDVPEPPGSHVAAEAEVRYPVPSATRAARAAEEPTIRIPSRITTRLRALDANLSALAARGGGNVVNAVLSLLTGGLAITLGALRNPNDHISAYLYVYGGTAAVRGVLDFVLSPNAQGVAITYQHMPMTSYDEVRERLAYGERALGGLAEQSLIARVLDASLNMAAGVAVVPIYLAPNDFAITSPLDYFVLIGAGVSIVSGIITLASTSAAEQRWGAYVQLRERLRNERREELEAGGEPSELDETALSLPPRGVELRFSLSPGFTGVSGTF